MVEIRFDEIKCIYWCNDSFGKGHAGHIEDWSTVDPAINWSFEYVGFSSAFHFRNEADEMMFKLRWEK